MDYTDINANTIDRWIEEGWEWGIPISHEEYQKALAGEWEIVLTPTKPVPKSWLGQLQGKRILGLASGGGQQMPKFAARGAECYVLDYSQKQIESEEAVAAREGYTVHALRADMTKPLPYGDFMRPVAATIKSVCYELSLPVPRILIEPGRAIVAPAGATLYTVGSVKTIPGVRTYVAVDGGMGDNPRYILYQAAYEILAAKKAAEPRTWTVTLAGKCCESGDLIQENAPIQPVEVGDPVAVLATGAYNYSMASNYNRVPRLPVVLVRDGESRLAVRRETYEDIIRLDE